MDIASSAQQRLWEAYLRYGLTSGSAIATISFSNGYTKLADAALDATASDEPEGLPISINETAEGWRYTGIIDGFIRRFDAGVSRRRVFAEILPVELKMRLWIAADDGRVDVVLPISEDMLEALIALLRGAASAWQRWEPRIAKTTVYMRRTF